jgi:DNA excision repair protein ERCC-3
MVYNPENPMIIQGDRTVLLEVDNSKYEEARDGLARFAELEKSPEHLHTYRLSPLSLWNAAATGMTANEILAFLESYTKFDIPENIKADILEYVSRYGRVKLIREGDKLLLTSEDRYLVTEIEHHKAIQPYLLRRVDVNKLEVRSGMRGHIKQALIRMGYPAEDLAGYNKGQHLDFKLRDKTLGGVPFSLRPYQQNAVDTFYAGGSSAGGSGVIVLPCGAGKTIVAMGAMEKTSCATLILTTNITAVRQWIDEIVDKSFLPRDMVGEYTGEVKEIKPITITTYQILTHRKEKTGDFPHFELFNSKDWGLIIYDEVHLLPAPIFRATAEIQATRRLGLTATLVREDGLQEDVFTLIGPKKYDVPWRDLEHQGWIASARCYEVRVPLVENLRMEYATAKAKDQYRIACENPNKLEIIHRLLDKHADDHILIIGQYISQLESLAAALKAPLITGKTRQEERLALYDDFKKDRIKLLVVSKVANFAIDLPDANVAIQISGTFGSRQEEAQRLGRILRPKKNGSLAYFYSIVTKETRDQDFAANRQLFLTEQGYRYAIVNGDELGLEA